MRCRSIRYGSTVFSTVRASRRRRVKEDFNARQAEQQPTVAQEAIAAAGMPQEIMPQMAESLAPKCK